MPITLYAQDRISVKVEFKKFIWACPVCGQEDIEDAKVAGGNEYVHTCSKCSAKFNQSGPNMKEYNGCLSYPYDTYSTVKQMDIDKEKVKRCDAWIYEVKHPPVYVEPKSEDLQKEIDQKMQEVQSLETRKLKAIENEKTLTLISD